MRLWTAALGTETDCAENGVTDEERPNAAGTYTVMQTRVRKISKQTNINGIYLQGRNGGQGRLDNLHMGKNLIKQRPRKNTYCDWNLTCWEMAELETARNKNAR